MKTFALIIGAIAISAFIYWLGTQNNQLLSSEPEPTITPTPTSISTPSPTKSPRSTPIPTPIVKTIVVTPAPTPEPTQPPKERVVIYGYNSETITCLKESEAAIKDLISKLNTAISNKYTCKYDSEWYEECLESGEAEIKMYERQYKEYKAAYCG